MSQLNKDKINKENLNKGNICIAFIKKQNTDYFQFDTFYLLNYIDSLKLSDVLNLYQEKVNNKEIQDYELRIINDYEISYYLY